MDVSHVQLARYMTAAEEALKSAFISSVEKPDISPHRYYARQQGSYTGKMKFSEFNQSPERATFPTLGFAGQPEVRRGDAPLTASKSNKKVRDEEGVFLPGAGVWPLPGQTLRTNRLGRPQPAFGQGDGSLVGA
ncbi:MAG: hypothetical protein EBS64_10085 [Verrucomicrobia bacterium]|nr:hypothetical protein [Verrucomicrobiota bacterium]